jgi:hypothetical protein
MKKIIFLSLVLILIVSCKTNYKILVSQPTLSDDEIHGYNLREFFKNKKDIRQVKIKDIEMLSREINLIKDSLNKIPALPDFGEKFGIYKYAFVISDDTLYSTSTFEGWRYENRVGKYEVFSSKLKAQIIKSSKNK